MTVVNVPTDKASTCVVCRHPNGRALGFEGRARYIAVAVTALGVPAEQAALLVADAWPTGAEEAEILGAGLCPLYETGERRRSSSFPAARQPRHSPRQASAANQRGPGRQPRLKGVDR